MCFFPFSSAALQTFLKYLFAQDFRQFVDVLSVIKLVYEANTTKKADHHALCTDYANYSSLILRFVPYSYICMFCIFGLFTNYQYFFNGGVLRAPIFLYLPSPNDDIDLKVDAVTLIANVVAILMVLAVLSAYDNIIHVTFCNVQLLATIFQRNLQHFEIQLKHSGLNNIDVKRKFIKIVHMHELYSG